MLNQTTEGRQKMIQFTDLDQLRWYNTFLDMAWEEANKIDAFNMVDPDAVMQGTLKVFHFLESIRTLGMEGYPLVGLSAELYNEYCVGGMLDTYALCLQEVGFKRIIELGYTDKVIRVTIRV